MERDAIAGPRRESPGGTGQARDRPGTMLPERWRAGVEAFRCGEIPPVDPDEAEGWYWAENSAGLRPPRD